MRLPSIFRTTPFRLTLLFLALFMAAAAAFLAYIYVATAGEVTRQASEDINREVVSLQTVYARGDVDALNQAAQKQVTIISAPAGSGKTSLLRAWEALPDRDPIAHVTVKPGQQDMQLFWLTLLSAIHATTDATDNDRQVPPVVPGANGSADA